MACRAVAAMVTVTAPPLRPVQRQRQPDNDHSHRLLLSQRFASHRARRTLAFHVTSRRAWGGGVAWSLQKTV
jgi:hypothetical protein